MKQSIMKKWVKALRSGQYKQGKNCLKSKSKRGVTRHCCLGVLCELYQKDEKKGKMKLDKMEGVFPELSHTIKTVYQFGSQKDMYNLPHCVKRWAAIKAGASFPDPDFDGVEFKGSFFGNLAELNDSGCSFSKIADIIEAKSDEL